MQNSKIALPSAKSNCAMSAYGRGFASIMNRWNTIEVAALYALCTNQAMDVAIGIGS